jgi:hypothetical protein
MSVGHGTARYIVTGTAVAHTSVDPGTAWHIVSGSSLIYLYSSALWIKSELLSKVDICILDNKLLTWTTQFLCPLLKRMQMTCTAWVTHAMKVGRKHIDPLKK